MLGPGPYLQLFAAAAADCGLPPLLQIAQCRQESGFDPGSVSSTGARGLMQIEPATAGPAYTKAQLLDPATSIALGARILRDCYDVFQRESGEERWKFALAAYNGGAGYVIEAQRLCAAAQGDPSQWGQVAPYLSGATVNGKRPDAAQIGGYVARVWQYYLEYQASPPAAPAPVAPAAPANPLGGNGEDA